MSAYYTRYCAEHGEFEADVDGDQECETCFAEGKTPIQVLQRDLAAAKAELSTYRQWAEVEIADLRDDVKRLRGNASGTAMDATIMTDTARLRELLHRQAKEIADEGHNGWGNTMTMAADRLDALDEGIEELAKAKLPGKNARAILPLLEELEEANAEIMEQCRLNAMGSEREAKLMAELELERKRRWEGNEISSNEHIAEVIQFKEKIRRARDEGIEAAAKVCDRWVESHIHSAIAKEIRALKGATDDQSQ